MPYSYATTIASGSTPNVAVPFGFIQRADVHVTRDGVLVDDDSLTWLSDSVVQLGSTPTAGTVVKVYRLTSATSLAITFTAPSIDDPRNLNTAFKQLLYVAQEAYDAGSLAAEELATITDYANSTLAAANEAATAAGGSASAAGTAVTTINAIVAAAAANALLIQDHAPLVGEGANGNIAVYLDGLHVPVYHKAAGAWTLLGNMLGVDGTGAGSVTHSGTVTNNHLAGFDGASGDIIKDLGAATAAGLAMMAGANVSAQLTLLGFTRGVGAFGVTMAATVDAAGALTALGAGSLATKSTINTSDITNDAVTFAKIQNTSATDVVLGRRSALGGDVEEITFTSAARALADDADATTMRGTLGLGALAVKATIDSASLLDANVVTLAKLATQATATFLGNISGGAAVPSALTATQVTLALNVAVGSGASHAIGLVPDPGSSAGTTRALFEDMTWKVPSGGGGSAVAGLASFRLTLLSGSALMLTDQLAKTTIYVTPDDGGQMAIWDGAAWNVISQAEHSIPITQAISGTTSTSAATITGLADTSQLCKGMTAAGTGVNGGATIASVDSGTQVTLTGGNGSANGTNTITFKVPASTNTDIFDYSNSGTLKALMLPWRNSGVAITGATNATPIVITIASGHLITAGDDVIVSGVGGNTAANGTWVAGTVTSTTVVLTSSVGNGTYTASTGVAQSRGAGAATSELDYSVAGIPTNKNAILAGSTSIAANKARFLGTIRTTATAGQTEFSYGGVAANGTLANFLVSNYNRLSDVSATIGDTTDSWALSSTSWRAANASNTLRVNYVDCVGRAVGAGYATSAADAAGAVTSGLIAGVGVDSITLPSGASTGNVILNSGGGIAKGEFYGRPGAGFHYLQALERADATVVNVAVTVYGDHGGLMQSALIARLRM